MEDVASWSPLTADKTVGKFEERAHHLLVDQKHISVAC